MTMDRIRAISFTKGTGSLTPVRVDGYRFFSDEYLNDGSQEIDYVIEGYGADNIADASFEFGVGRYSGGVFQRTSVTISSTGAGVPHDFQSDHVILVVGVTERAIQRIIDDRATFAQFNSSQIQGRNIASTAPNPGDSLRWNGTQWIPQADNQSFTPDRAIVSDGTGVLAASSVTSTEINALAGIDSNIQDQLDAKAASTHTHSAAGITGVQSQRLLGRTSVGTGDAQEISIGASLEFSGGTIQRAAISGEVTIAANSNSATITNGAVTNAKIASDAGIGLEKLATVTPNRALISDGSGRISPSSITDTELSTLDNITSNIQDQLNAKSSTSHTHVHDSLVGSGSYSHTQIDSHLGSNANPHGVTAAQVGNDVAQWNASEIQGNPVSNDAPANNDVLVFNLGQWAPAAIPAPVQSVHGRTGNVVATPNDYDWSQIDKTTSDLADLTTKSHNSLTDIGTNSHDDIDSHISATNNPHNVTSNQVGRSVAQWNADKIMGYPVTADVPTNGQQLIFNGTHYVPTSTVSVVTDHSGLTGIGTNSHEDIDLHIASTSNPHSVTKAQVGLGNVDNTSDINKPISTATQSALNAKSDVGHAHAISDVSGLQTALDGKASSVHTHAISDVTGLSTALNGKENTGIASSLVANHEGLPDPHPQYTTAAEAAAASPVQSVAGKIGAVTLAISDVTNLQITIDAKVADSIADGVTTIAPSQNAVFDALAGKEATGVAASLDASHVAALDPHPQYTTAAEAASAAPVQSVAGKTGVVTLVIGDVASLQSTIDAKVSDAIADGVTTVAPSQNAVFDALALKANSSHTHVISDVTNLQTTIDAKVADAIADGVTTIAPSQNAVFDALALKASASALSSHEGLTAAHGATGAVVGTTNSQTLQNKTIEAGTFTQVGTVSGDLRKDSRSAFDSYGPTFTYTSGVLTSITYASDGSVKTFTYTSGVLTRIEHALTGRTIRKDFNYTSGVLTSITETVI